jgi:peptidyl-prolyl cis-trans isomerase C
VSPASPNNDLSKPLFDTITSIYNVEGFGEKAAKTVVAEIDGRAITLGDVGDVIRDAAEGQRRLPFEMLFPVVLQQLVQRQALVIQAQRRGLDDDPTVRRRMRAAADQVLATALIEAETAAVTTEQTLLDEFAKIWLGKPGPEQVHLRLIMTDTESAARDAIKQIKAGADFAALAKQISKDSSARNGGDLGFAERDGLIAEIGAVAFVLDPGEVARYPVAAKGSWFVVKTEERRTGPTPHFHDLRHGLLLARQQRRLEDVLRSAQTEVIVRGYPITGKTDDGNQP